MSVLHAIGAKAYAVRIVERNDDWLLTWPIGKDTETHPCAALALKAVQDMARALAGGGESTVFVIEWRPTTDVGRRVVNALSTSEATR